MYQPEAYGVALLFMVLSMLCWGVGEHGKAVSRISLSIVLLGLCDRTRGWCGSLGHDVRKHG